MTTLAEALAQLDGKPVLSADDALALRRILYGGASQAVTAEEAEALIKLNAGAGDAAPEWRMLFVEALTDYVVRQQEPAGYVDQAKADWLMAAVSRDGLAKDDEVEALIYVLEQADSTPPSYAPFVLEALKSLILKRPAKGITAADVERLRRVLFAAGGESNVGVSQHEAEALFDLNDALRAAANDPAWSDFFVRAVANAVLYQATWQAPDAQAELGREAWLADTSFHLPNLKSLLHPLQALATPGVGQAWSTAVDADEATEARASQVT
jgi:hypothetical protein